MKAKEYYDSTRMIETRNWTLDMAMSFAEEYYEARTKTSHITDVNKPLPPEPPKDREIHLGGFSRHKTNK
jgi:hypothetical protein